MFADGDHPSGRTELTARFNRPVGVQPASRTVYDVDAAAYATGPYVSWRPARDVAGGYVVDVTPVAAPEPGPFVVLLAGLLGVAWARWRRR